MPKRFWHWLLDGGLPYYVAVESKNSLEKNLKTDSKNSFTLQKYPLRNSSSPQKFMRAPLRMLDMFYRFEHVFRHFEVKIDRSIISNGC